MKQTSSSDQEGRDASQRVPKSKKSKRVKSVTNKKKKVKESSRLADQE